MTTTDHPKGEIRFYAPRQCQQTSPNATGDILWLDLVPQMDIGGAIGGQKDCAGSQRKRPCAIDGNDRLVTVGDVVCAATHALRERGNTSDHQHRRSG